MSLLETVMLVVFGFAVASLIALFLGKAAWNIAYRLGARRTRKQIPGNLNELQAERNRLRVEYAMLRRRTEVEAEQLKSRHVEQLAEVMRNRNRIGLLGEELAVRDKRLAGQESEINTLREQLAVVEAELARRTETIQSMEERIRQLEGQVAAAAAVTAGDEPLVSQPAPGEQPYLRLDAYRPPPAPAPPDSGITAAQDRLSLRIRDLTRLSAQINNQRSHHSAQRPALHEIKPSPLVPPPSSAAATTGSDEQQQDSVGASGNLWLDPPPPEPYQEEQTPETPRPPEQPVSPSIANVISLAQRLRTLKKEGSN